MQRHSSLDTRHFPLCIVLAALFAANTGAMATTWYVASNANGGDEANNGLSPATPKSSLSTLVNNAAEDDTIYVVGTLPVSSTITVAKRLLIAGYGPDAAISGGNTCLPLKLNASGLVVSNLVIHSGSPVGAAANSWTYPASGVAVVNGTLVDCTVRDCSPQGATHTSTINISGPGTVLRCAIINNTAGIQTASYAAGLFINDSRAVVRDCEIAYNRGRAAAVFLASGLVTGCDIHDNRNYPVSELASGVAVGSGAGIRLDAGTLDRSRIHDNYSYGSGGGIWIRDNALVRNCLVYGNHAEVSGGAIHANSSSPKAYHCNIGGNTAGAGGAAINSEAGSPQYVNCIVFGNGSDPSDEILTASGVTASFTYCLLPVTSSGTGNGVLVDSPFHDESNGDYLTAVPFAAAIDKGRNSLATTDFLGTVRPVDGDADGTATADIGAVEYHNLPASLEKNTDYVVNCATGAAPTQIYVENSSLTLANRSWVNFNSTGNAWGTNFLLHVTGGSVASNFTSALSIPTGGRIVVDDGSTLRLKNVPHEVSRATATGTSMAITNSTLFMAGDMRIYGFSNTVTLCNSRLTGNQTVQLYGIGNRLVFSGDCGTTPISLGIFTGTNNWIVLEDGARFASTPSAKLQCSTKVKEPFGYHIGRNALLYLGYTGLIPPSTGTSNGWVIVESGGELTLNNSDGEGAVSGYNVRLNNGTLSCSNNMMRVGSNSNHWGTRLELNGDNANVFAMNLVIGNTVDTTNLTITLNPGAGAFGDRAPLWSKRAVTFNGPCVFKIDLRAPLRARAANEILRLPVAQAAVAVSGSAFTLSAENLAKLNEQLVTQPPGGRLELDGKVLYCVMKRKATTVLAVR